MRANYPKHHPAVTRKIRFPHAQYQQNFFTRTQIGILDRGTQFTSEAFTAMHKHHCVDISMDGRGC